MPLTMSKIHYKFILIKEDTNEVIKEARSLKAIKDFLFVSLYPTGTKFRVERKVYQGDYLLGVYINYKQYQIA